MILPEEKDFKDKEFNYIKKLVLENTGIVLNSNKKSMVYGRIVRRLKALNLPDFKAYCNLIQDANSEEFGSFINSITTNHTNFFRENHHFEFLGEDILKELKARNQNSINIWSSACSKGHEPYSIAYTVEHSPYPIASYKILATDLDSNVLATAKQGIYDITDVKDIELNTKKQMFLRGSGDKKDQVKIQRYLQEHITYSPINLIKDWQVDDMFDLIFCRNVAIYFDKPTKEKLYEKLIRKLVPGGYLMIGHSETLSGPGLGLVDFVSRAIYRKK